MFEELEWPVVLNPYIFFKREGPEPLQILPADVKVRDTFYHGKVFGAKGQWASIQF